MVAAIISACALALSVATLVGCALRTSQLRDAMSATLNTLESRIERTSTATLRAELEDLRGALDVMAASNRREFGSLWGRMGGRSNGQLRGAQADRDALDDPELQAMLALQTAPTPKP